MGGISSCFLDLKITIDNTKALVYGKPTDNHFYLNGNSCHLTKSINRISTLVANRLRRICSNDSDSQEQSKKYSPTKSVKYLGMKIDKNLRSFS